ncbi:MAG: inositol 2-dehydrogenase [Chloroflexota bacterium]
MGKKFRLGLIGCGRIGIVHAAAAQAVPSAEIVRVVDVFAEAAEKLGKEYGVPYSTNHHDILDDPEIDGVLICSSTDTHAQFITESAEAGKQIFCEKPIHNDIAEIDKALTAVEKAGVKLMVGFQRRFDPNFKAAQEAIAAGKIGDVHIVKITSRDPAPPPISYIKVSGGIFIDMSIHDFDMARFLTGSEVEEVYAVGAVRIDPEIGEAGDVDTAVMTLKFENGAIAIIDNSRQAVYGYDQRIEVFGSKGMVDVDNNFPNNHRLHTADAISSEKPLHFFLERYMEAYSAEIQVFVESVVNDTDVPVSGIDGRWPVLIGEAAWKSVRENRPVTIAEIQEGHSGNS